MGQRPVTTLFMLESLDGKISSGAGDNLDADRDWCRIEGVAEGLHQYYEIEQATDLCSLNTGRVMAKIGVNDRTGVPVKSPCTFVILDSRPHLNERGLDYLCRWVSRLILVTTNPEHPAFSLREKYENLVILYYNTLELSVLMEELYARFGIKRVTVQSGGSLNGLFLRSRLLDYVHIIVAPLLVGGREVPTLIDGEAITGPEELNRLAALELMECRPLQDSYIELKYRVKYPR